MCLLFFRSHKKHKKHKKHSDKDKGKPHKSDALDRKRAPSPKARSRSHSPLTRKNRGRSPGRERDVGGASWRRHSSPSPRDGRRNASNREMGLKNDNKYGDFVCTIKTLVKLTRLWFWSSKSCALCKIKIALPSQI